MLDNVARLCPSFGVKGYFAEFGVRNEVRFTALCFECKESSEQICYSKSFKLFPLWTAGILSAEYNCKAFEQQVKVGCTSVGCFCTPRHSERTIMKLEGISKVSFLEANMKIPMVLHIKSSKVRKPRSVLISLLELVSIRSHKVLYALEPIGTHLPRGGRVCNPPPKRGLNPWLLLLRLGAWRVDCCLLVILRFGLGGTFGK